MSPEKSFVNVPVSRRHTTAESATDENLHNKLSVPLTMGQVDSIIQNRARFEVWLARLTKGQEFNIPRFLVTDEDINQVVLDLPNQRVVKCDCQRSGKKLVDENLKPKLEKLLTLYCKRENIGYKQGMHEILASFLNFHQLGVGLNKVYLGFSLFITKNMSATFADGEFASLQSNLRVLKILMKFHEPMVYVFFSRNNITPELYATPWFITLFTYRMKLEIMYTLWDLYILENKPYFILFMSLALISINRDSILSCEPYVLPQHLTSFQIEDMSQLKTLMDTATQLENNTPKSFLDAIRNLEIFRSDYNLIPNVQEKVKQNLDYYDQLHSLVVQPSDIISRRVSLSPSQTSIHESPFSPTKYDIMEYVEQLPHLEDLLPVNPNDTPSIAHNILIDVDHSVKVSESRYKELSDLHIIRPRILNDETFPMVVKQIIERWNPQTNLVIASATFDSKMYHVYTHEEKSQKKCKGSKLTKIKSSADVHNTDEMGSGPKVVWLLHKLLKKKFSRICVLDAGTEGLNKALHPSTTDSEIFANKSFHSDILQRKFLPSQLSSLSIISNQFISDETSESLSMTSTPLIKKGTSFRYMTDSVLSSDVAREKRKGSKTSNSGNSGNEEEIKQDVCINTPIRSFSLENQTPHKSSFEKAKVLRKAKNKTKSLTIKYKTIDSFISELFAEGDSDKSPTVRRKTSKSKSFIAHKSYVTKIVF